MVAQVPGLHFSEVYFKNVCSKRKLIWTLHHHI